MRALPPPEPSASPLYERVADDVARLIEQGTFRPGDRVPSVRGLSRQLQVSVSTVLGAYALLEDRGLIEPRPQAGYFVKPRFAPLPAEPLASRPDAAPTKVSTSELVMMVLRDTRNANLVQLGASVPDPANLPVEKLNRSLTALTRVHRLRTIGYEVSPGSKALRTQIAKRALLSGCALGPEELLITSGAQEAVFLALATVCRPGDAVACESPIFYGILQAIERLGLRVVEIPSHPREGIVLSALQEALGRHPIRAVVTVSNFSNPLGSCMPVEAKRELVAMLEKRDIPLIEDDLYGDLPHGGARPEVARAFSKKGLVLLCSSFSKTIAPGYRLGWIAPGRFYAEIERLKFVINIASSTLSQLTVAEFLAEGGYDHYLRSVRRVYAQQVARMARAVAQSFPAGTRVTRPEGGFVLWVELPRGSDSLTLYEGARAQGMTIAPGPIFSARRRYRNFIRLNCAAWNDTIERAIANLGALAHQSPDPKSLSIGARP